VKTTIAAAAVLLALIVIAVWLRQDHDQPATQIPENTEKEAVNESGVPTNNAGPAKWDAAGRFRCSLDKPTFTRTCGFRLVHHKDDKSVDIWIRNLAKDKAEYRVFHYANETFATNDDSKVTWQRKDNNWWVSVNAKEFYAIPYASLRAG